VNCWATRAVSIQRSERSGRRHQQRRRRRRPAQRHLQAALEPGGLGLEEGIVDLRPGLVEQGFGPVGESGVEGGGGGAQHAPGAVPGRRRELGPEQQERRLRAVTAALAGPGRGLLELGSEGLVGPPGRGRQVLRPPIGFGGPVGAGGEGGVHGPPQVGGCPAVDRGADQRVAERQVGARAEQAGGDDRVLGRADGAGVAGRVGDGGEVGGHLPHEGGVAGGVGRRDQGEQLRRLVEGTDLTQEVLLQARPDGQRLEHDPSPAELVVGQVRGQLEQRQRAAARRCHDAPGQTGVDLDVGPGGEEVESGPVGQAIDGDRGQAPEDVGGPHAVPHPEEQADAVRRQPAPDERQGGQRLLVDPLGVVDHAEQTLLGGPVGHLGRSGQQGEAGEPDEEAVGRTLVVEPEGRAEGRTLGSRQIVEAVEERAQQAVQARVAEVALGLDAGDPDAAQVPGGAHHVLEQAGLAHPGLAVNDARPTDTAGHRRDQVVESPTLVDAIQQGRLLAPGWRRHRRHRRHCRSGHPLPVVGPRRQLRCPLRAR
jgi:hypothetical protein